jgi:hypothetical protein
MTRSLQLFVCLATLAGTALAQAATDQGAESTASTSSPVAYVYVARPTHIDGFAASSSGKHTPVPGSPFSNIAVSHLSVTKKYLFGPGDNGGPDCGGPDPVCSWDIYTYSIASNGALKQAAVINPYKYGPTDCFAVGPTQIDATGTTLYNDALNCDGDDQYVQSFKIESNGELQFLASEDSGAVEGEGFLSPMVVLGNNKYAYQTGCDGYGPSLEAIGLKRESNGAVAHAGTLIEPPKGKTPEDIYCASGVLAADPTNHLAFALQDTNNNYAGPIVLASYTADSEGNLTTTSTYENMPSSGIGFIGAMSISPSGKLLAIGGGGQNVDSGPGFQIFHFNGSSPITHYSAVLQPGIPFQQFAWDGDNHLYALGGGELFVYTVTSTSIKEASGSPYSIPESSSVIVLTK